MIKNNINNNVLPRHMPNSYTFTINFALGNPYIIDLTKDLMLNSISKTIQSAWIDNSGNVDNLIVNIPETGQSITIFGNTQGLYPVIVPHQTGSIHISSASNSAIITVILLDIPIDFMNYSLNASDSVDIVGIASGLTLPVSIAATQPVSIAAATATVPVSIAATQPVSIAAATATVSVSDVNKGTNIAYYTITSASALATVYQIIAAPVSPSYLTLTGLTINVSAAAIAATAGNMLLTFFEATTVLFEANIYIPSAVATQHIIEIPSNNIVLAAADNFNFTISTTALSGGTIDIFANYLIG